MKLKYGHYAHAIEDVDVTINRTCLDVADLFEVQINGSTVTKSISKAHFPARQQYEEQAASEIAAILAEHRKQIVRAVGSPPKYGNIPAKLWRQQAADFVRVLIPVMTRAHLTADKNLTRRLGGKGAADVIEDAANLYAQDAARDLAGDLVRTTRKGTRDALAATREQMEASGGKFTSVLAAKLVTVTGPSRASMIAVTETTNAHTAGESAAATRWNAEAKREARRRGRQAPRLIPIWVAQPGCCDVCLGFDGQGREVWGKEFPNGPSAHPHCILPENLVVPMGEIQAGSESFYDGPCVEVCFANGRKITITNNHPVLTPSGWVAGKLLREGGYVICTLDAERVAARINPHDDNSPTAIEQLYRSLEEVGEFSRVPTAPEYFHGDARFMDGNIHVVSKNRLLLGDSESFSAEHFGQENFSGGNVGGVGFVVSRAFDFGGEGLLTSSNSVVGLLDHRCPSCGRGLLPAEQHGFSPTPWRDARFQQTTSESGATDTRLAREFLFRFSSDVSSQQITKIRKFNYTGHVYDLQCGPYELYTVDSVVVHNCRCRLRYILANTYRKMLQMRKSKQATLPTIYIDLDGVLVDLPKGIKNATGREPSGKGVDLRSLVRMRRDGVNIKDFFANLDWTSDGRQLWDSLKRHNPIILTSGSNDAKRAAGAGLSDIVEGKLLWCQKNLGISADRVIVESEKQKYAGPNSILIDDWDKNIQRWQEAGGVGVLHTTADKSLAAVKQMDAIGGSCGQDAKGRFDVSNTCAAGVKKALNECGQQADGRFDQGNTCAAGGASVDEYVVAPGDTLERRRAGIASLLGYESKSPRIQYDPATGMLAIQPANTREERAQDARVLSRIADVMRRQTPPAWQSNAPWYSALVADNERIQATWKAAQAAKDADDIARATAPTPNEEQLGELLFPPADRVGPADATAHIGDKYKKLGTPRIKLSGYSIPDPHVRKPTSMKQAKEDVAALVAMAEQNHKDYQTGSDKENVEMRESALKRAYNAAVRNAKEKGVAEDLLPKYPAPLERARDNTPAVARAAVKWSAQSTLADIQREAKKRMAIGTVEVAMTGPDKQLYKQAPKAGTLEAANTALEAIASTNKKLDGWYKRAMSPLDMVVVDQKPDNTTPIKVVARYAEGSSMPGAKGNRLEIAANPVDRRGKFPLTAPLTIGEEYVDRSIAGNARRAYGLHLWKGIADQFVSPVNTLAVEWGTAMGNTKISEAVFSAQDAFAESVSAYTHPDYQPGDLPESIEQFLDKYFVQETTPLIQKKYRLGVRKALDPCGQNKDGTFATGNNCAAELNRGPAPPTQVKLYGDTFVPSRTAKEKASWLIKAARIFQNKNKFGYVVVDEAKLQAAEKSLHATLDKMPPIMARMAANNINNVVIYNNLSELTLNFLPGEFGEKLIKNGKQIGGAFDGRADEDNTLHLDGLEEPYTDLGIEGLYAHELGHAVDVGLKYSSQPAWKQAWEIEIKLMSDGEYRLSKYAAERPSEGWAEYCRLIVTDPTVARERFPACWGLLERAGFFDKEGA